MTWRELVYMIVDITKQISDDSNFNEDHIITLCSTYRNYILNQQYLTNKKTIAETNYQIIQIPLERYSLDICPDETILRSVKPISFPMTIGEVSIYPTDILYSRSKIVFVPQSRFAYVGNKYSRHTIYAMIGADRHLYLRSQDKNFLYLESVTIKALFEDAKEMSLLDSASCGCDIMDIKFPLEHAWINTLINLVVTDLLRGTYNLRDTDNDAFDSTDQLAQMIQRYTNNSFKRLMQGNKNNNG